MSKSYSKIRHIQESNSRLEKRFLKETMEFDIQGQATDDFLNLAQEESSSLGAPANFNVSDYVDTDNPVCTPQTGDANNDSILDKVATWASSQTDVNVLRNEAKKLISFMKKPMAEQVTAAATATGLVIGGSITIGPAVLGVIAGLVLVILITNIIRLVAASSNRKYRGGKCASYHRHGRTNNPERVLSW